MIRILSSASGQNHGIASRFVRSGIGSLLKIVIKWTKIWLNRVVKLLDFLANYLIPWILTRSKISINVTLFSFLSVFFCDALISYSPHWEFRVLYDVWLIDTLIGKLS